MKAYKKISPDHKGRAFLILILSKLSWHRSEDVVP